MSENVVPEVDKNNKTQDYQVKAYTRWVNYYLAKRDLKVEDIFQDFQDGVKLIILYEVLSETSLGRYNKPPFKNDTKSLILKIDNLSIVLKEVNKFVGKLGIKLHYSPEQILNGDKGAILGLLWCFVNKFTIVNSEESDSASIKKQLFIWLEKRLQNYKNLKVESFVKGWKDGLALCALVHSFCPEKIDFDKLDPSESVKNLQLAIDVADDQLDIPPLLDANDFEDFELSEGNEKSMMTYLAYFWKKDNK